jgi:hypothetical protein
MQPNNRLAPPLRNSLASYVPAPLDPGMLPPEVSPRYGMRDRLTNLSMGMGRGLTDQLEGTKQLVTQPVATAQALIEAARQVGADPRIILDMLRAARQKAMSGSLGLGELLGENLTPGVRGARAPVSRITEPERAFGDLWHGSPNPAFERFDPNVRGEFTGRGALGPGHYVGQKGYAEGFAGRGIPEYEPPPNTSLTQWKPNIKKSLYFDDEGFTPNTPRANAANRKAFEAVKKVDPELAYRVFEFKGDRVVAIRHDRLVRDADGKPRLSQDDFIRAMDIAGIDSVVDLVPGKGIHQVMVRDPANLKRVD